jgi:hypothetical protein
MFYINFISTSIPDLIAASEESKYHTLMEMQRKALYDKASLSFFVFTSILVEVREEKV